MVIPTEGMVDLYELIRKSEFFDAGCLFVVMTGISTLLKFVNMCGETCNEDLYQIDLMKYDIKSMSRGLINVAKNQHRALLLNTRNDDMVFVPLPPFEVDSINKYAVIKHIDSCDSEDCAFGLKDSIKISNRVNNYLPGILEKYNKWTTLHARSMGYKNFHRIYESIKYPYVCDKYINRGDIKYCINYGFADKLCKHLKDWKRMMKLYLQKGKVSKHLIVYIVYFFHLR